MEKSVKLTPHAASEQDKVKINYSGLLAEAGAEEIYLHAGLGNQYNWQSIQNVKMKPAETEDVWTAELKVTDAKAVNFCFKDSADNWDNNSGYNWSYDLLT